MVEKFQIFEMNIILKDRQAEKELEDEFHNFFYKYNLTPLFTNEHRAGSIKVSWAAARSVVNGTGYAKTLKEFADILTMHNDNKSYEEALFKMIYVSSTFDILIRNIKKVMEFIETIDEDHIFNMWNIVFYNKDLL